MKRTAVIVRRKLLGHREFPNRCSINSLKVAAVALIKWKEQVADSICQILANSSENVYSHPDVWRSIRKSKVLIQNLWDSLADTNSKLLKTFLFYQQSSKMNSRDWVAEKFNSMDLNSITLQCFMNLKNNSLLQTSPTRMWGNFRWESLAENLTISHWDDKFQLFLNTFVSEATKSLYGIRKGLQCSELDAEE